ncbi:TPA: hypothetical protein N0F65_001181 [Lagenidium giganteum]|uniref:RING-type domain-containing protein n=1 Tax=Lagenidium giganteum TaxID=4803 RepID=A0AAV2Z7U4_9STRA|nr:TPA: hypothetical protein N0F65_001181 [Lagenidium giganteum]
MAAKTQECHICLEELREHLAACPCCHVFHNACIVQALHVNLQCPICRRRVTERQLVNLFFEAPADATAMTRSCGGGGSMAMGARGVGYEGSKAQSAEVLVLTERVGMLMERLQRQNNQYELAVVEMKRLRSQSEQIMHDRQSLLRRIQHLEKNKTELTGQVAKYQMEASQQAETVRQLQVNQSIINYLNSCDDEVLEDEVQNPRELIVALKKACKFRHDQYEKVVKEKMRLKQMLQQQQMDGHASVPSRPSSSNSDQGDRRGKMKASTEPKRPFPHTDYAPFSHSAPQEHKKRKVESESSNDAMYARSADSAAFRASAYSDLNVRPGAAPRPTLARSIFNPSQYGSYNITPSPHPPVRPTDNSSLCRRGYDETGKLTNFMVPREQQKRATQPRQQAKPPTPTGMMQQSMLPSMLSRRQPGGGQEFTLTSWLRKGA